jgi:UDP-GlcNAc3NAcA epimerase
MLKICTIIGARPQFIKAAAVSAKIAEMQKNSDISEVIIHTGQHYDADMSKIFFEELNIPKEKYNLEVGSGLHGAQTGKMLEGIENILIQEEPDWVLIYGDTNSTLAGALAAVKMHIPVAHIEAGMRSFNRQMPEEINRIVADSISTLNLCSTSTAVDNLKSEGMGDTAFLTGDVMYDCALNFEALAEKYCDPLSSFALSKGEYILMTCHRAENTDDKLRLSQIVSAVNKIAEKHTVLYPMHPRTASFIEKYDLEFSDKVKVVPPVGYLDMLVLEKNAEIILTDSGGIQKEAFFYQVPCVTMRDETEWVETVELGWNILTGASEEKIINSVAKFADNRPPLTDKHPYGNGNAAEIIIEQITKSQT